LLGRFECIIHCAARVHRSDGDSNDSLRHYQKINVQGAMALAEQSASCGVKRFIFLSSIGVNGRQSVAGTPFRDTDPPNPFNAYTESKLQAELGLLEIADQSGLEVVVLRPPMIYGPNAPGNFSRLIRLIKGGLPLPLASIRNQRSLLGIDNLAELIFLCRTHPAVANRVLLACDGEDLSTPELIRTIAAALQTSARLVSAPDWILRTGSKLLGKSRLYEQLCGNLQIDATSTFDALGWTPQVNVESGIRRALGACLPVRGECAASEIRGLEDAP